MKPRLISLATSVIFLVGCATNSQPPPSDLIAMAGLNEERGLRVNTTNLLPGYILFTPLISDTTYLINRDGQVVHTWKGEYGPASTYFLEDGHLMRGGRDPNAPRFNAGGQGGFIEKFNWNGEVVWSYELASYERLLHHDFEVMPNGNILAIAWENKNKTESLSAGRRPAKTPEAGLWPDIIVEIEPQDEGGHVVWEWRAWDHMLQYTDPDLPNYGNPIDFPHKIDINAGPPIPQVTTEQLDAQKENLRTTPLATVGNRGSDMHHSNAIAYNPELDQIAISVRSLNEIWVIDHSISTEEAKGSAGDLLYRWGNPAAYGHPEPKDIGLGLQHDIRWIPEGFPGAGNLTAFSNTAIGSSPPVSETVEFAPPLNSDGTYHIEPGQPFGPQELVWNYSDDYWASFISGAHRMSNGNTFIDYGPQGRFIEVNREGEIVWEYWSLYSGEVRLPGGFTPQPIIPNMYSAFRATFIPSDHPGLANKTLRPLSPQPAPSVLNEEELAPFRN